MLIGVYRSRNPLKSLPKDRLYALANEALRQDVELVFFHTANVNFHNEYINGKIYNGEAWETKQVPFPKVMINEWPDVPKDRSENEKKLRKKIHSTTYLIDGKLSIYNMLEKSEKYRYLVIPSKHVETVEELISYVAKHNQVVIKPVGGRRGLGIYFITEADDHFIVKDHTEESSHSEASLSQWLKQLLNEKRYIAQPYVNCRTNQGEPYDFRIHVQRDGNAQWTVTKTYPRIGATDSILSNISRGGYTESIGDFLMKEFADRAEEILTELEATAIGAAEYINQQYRFMIDELGIDLAIDRDGQLWLYEVNTGPQTRYHEEERAVNTIAYAKYLTEQRIPVEEDGRLTVAMLTGIEKGTALKKACQHAANAENVNFFFFTPEGINEESRTIDGFYYVGERRVARRFNYPDAIFDRFRMKGIKKHKKTYEALKEIPFTNNRVAGSVSKQVMYQKIEKQGRFNEYLIPYEPVKNFESLLSFIKEHKRVIIKSNHGSYGSNVYQLQYDGKSFSILEKKKTIVLNTEELSAFYDNNWSKHYIVQRYIHSYSNRNEPYDIRVHLVKNRDKEWGIAEKYARIGSKKSFTSNLALGGYVRKFEDYLLDNFDAKDQDIMRLKVDSLAYSFSEHFHELFKVRIDEIGLDIGIDENKNLWLFEVNINRPGTTFHEYEVAKLAIPYAATLAREVKES